ncbi:hypothetical protein PGT21_029204 [Puccinia graminis f. sp. tritici]|uniref:Uncharacterized protein n=1 Tax=Puccinia graminis f. sp. tritici TaxID=56615 RepID=A0A5B0M847_PUCGR|nr:hypothetical protein PGT21_029204 [Puccinia graminis f. sp. tritici]
MMDLRFRPAHPWVFCDTTLAEIKPIAHSSTSIDGLPLERSLDHKERRNDDVGLKRLRNAKSSFPRRLRLGDALQRS